MSRRTSRLVNHVGPRSSGSRVQAWARDRACGIGIRIARARAWAQVGSPPNVHEDAYKVVSTASPDRHVARDGLVQRDRGVVSLGQARSTYVDLRVELLPVLQLAIRAEHLHKVAPTNIAVPKARRSG